MAFVGVVSTPSASAEVAAPKSQTAMLAQIDQLMKLIADLQKQLNAAKGEIKELMTDLSEGAEGDDVLKAQEVLATDPSIFGVKPTGFFGPKTKEALMKFQTRYGLEVTGKLDEATREAMKELREDGKVAPGLLLSDEAKDRIKSRLKEKWGDCDFTRPVKERVCEKVKDGDKGGKHDEDDDEDESDDDDSSDDDSDDEVTRDDARRAVVDAQNEVNSFRDSIKDMEEGDATKDEINEARDTLRDAQKKLVDARRALVKGDFQKAFHASEDALEVIAGDDDSDDEDSEDEDEDEDEDDEDEDQDDDSDEDDSEDDE